MWRFNKYRAVKTYSELCERTFDSKAEARRGEELKLLERAGEIRDLQYQVLFSLCQKPKIAIKIDFSYRENGQVVYEDVKGMGETREFRVKRAWLKEKHGVDVVIYNPKKRKNQ
jgi:hypothetical protein